MSDLSEGEFRTVAVVEAIAENQAVTVEIDGISILVCNVGDGIIAVENRCSHQNKPLSGGRIRNGYIFCPVHGMRFRLATGEAIGTLTREPINVFETRIVGGTVQVRRSLPPN